MNVFVLNAGRSGSTTFARACSYIENYTAAHESRRSEIGPGRLAYPDDHIEVDNRLAWLLGRLEVEYGSEAAYVHLRRDQEATIRSHAARIDFGIMAAYREAIIWRVPATVDPLEIARDYLLTVERNIELFLRDKPRRLDFWLENASADFERFWQFIGAAGDYEAAAAEFEVRHNARAAGGS